ncbi:MAG: adenylate/guanylate cyclase domain-containing protein [Saprospirales bacterium]|nr:adenylate/guanylate cyclase domain-containing protein [Saprospirales bacterium]
MRRIHEVTSKFVPYEFIRALGRNSLRPSPWRPCAERKVTVMFTDVRDYTTRAEQMSPEESFHFVSELNGFIGPIIRKNRGFVNQYLGDGVMAIFPRESFRCTESGDQHQKAIQQYNRHPEKHVDHQVKMGIGMHTGDLIMGITGDHQRMEAATISDTVNTAARIEGLTKTYEASILLTQETFDQIENPNEFQIQGLGKVQLKGKQAPVHIYECLITND